MPETSEGTATPRFSPQARRRARRAALQALYQWQMTSDESREIIRQFLDEPKMSRADIEYFKALVYGVTQAATELDQQFEDTLDRPLAQIDPIEHAILRIGTFELLERIEVPLRVVINEGVELAKTFGGEQSHRYINGILDKLATKLRPGL
ncbi:MAG: transcription antitermination factor NusB [Pseudomonadota bacterium]